MNLLLDTNVVIDYLGKKAPFFENAERIIAMGYFGDATLWTPAQSLKDAFYVLSHYADPLRVQTAILKLLEVVHLVDMTAQDVADAARLQWDDMEDCLIAISAGKVRADYLVTRDRKGFKRSMVAPISPEELLRVVREEKSVVYAGIDWAEYSNEQPAE